MNQLATNTCFPTGLGAGVCVLLAASLATPAAVMPQTADGSLRLSGQVGFRVEYISNENFAENDLTRDDDNRLRFRARVRLAGSYQASDIVSLGLRLTTGSPDYPSSHWSSLNDEFRRDPFLLDRAFVHLRPSDKLQLRFGLDGNPIFRPTELVWDGDVSPGGRAEVLALGNVELVAGQFMLREVRSLRPENEENSFLFAHSISYSTGGTTSITAGAYHYLYSEPDALAAALIAGRLNNDFLTNRFHPLLPDEFFSDFSVLGGGLKIVSGPITFVAEAAVNLEAESDPLLGAAFFDKENFAAGGMVTYGPVSDAWDFALAAGFFHIEADAVIAAFNSDDLQQTNVNSIPIVLRVKLPGGAGLVWDTYIQSKIDEALASNGGVVHDENATKVRTRLTLQANF